MNISSRQEGQVTVVSISGSLDTFTATDATHYLSTLIQQGQQALVLDLTATDYMSSAGLRVLLAVVKQARAAEGDLRLVLVDQELLGILNMAGFTRILSYYTDLPSAVASFHKD